MGLQTAQGNCGIINLIGEQLPPPEDKWSEVDFPKGHIKIRADSYPGASKGSKWVDLEKNDLAKLARFPLKETFMARAVGPIISGARVMVSAGSDYNAYKALACRVFRPPPQGETGLWRFAASFSRAILPLWDDPPPEMSEEDWLASMPSKRQKPLRQAMELYKRTGWDQKYSKFKAFIKCELLPFFDKNGDGLMPLRAMVDRLINAPHDVTHAIAGRKIKPYLKWLKEQWNVDNHLFYAGTSPDKLQKWLRRATSDGPKMVFWSDYSMFDSSHNEETWEFVESMYNQHSGDADFINVLNSWRIPSGTLRNLKYRARAMNASGRDDTALANAILNGFAMLLSVTASWYRKPLKDVTRADLDRISSELILSICGDDALGFLPSTSERRRFEFITDCRANLKSFGFKAKMFASDRFEDAVYLGHRPVLVDGVYYWSRTLGRCLYKLGWQNGIHGDPAAHFMGICQMHQRISRHVPVLSDITEKWMESRKGAKINEYKFDEYKPWKAMSEGSPDHYSQDTLESLARAYTVDRRMCRQDLSCEDVFVTAADFEQLILYVRERVDGSPCVLDHWLLRHMIWVDEQ